MIRGLRRALKRGGARLLGGALSRLARRSMPTDPRRVLVVRIDERVGNVLLTTPLLRQVQARWPSAEVTALVAASKASILHGIATLEGFDKKAAWRRPLAFARQLRALRRAGYDLVIDAAHWHHFSLTSAVLTAWTGAPARIGHDRGEARRFYTHAIPPPPAPEWEVDTKLRLLAPFGAVPAAPPLETSLGRGPAAEAMAAWLAARGIGAKGYVGIAPGSRKRDHRADPALFAALGRRAAEAGWPRIVLWGPGEEALAADVADRCGATVAPPTSLDELAALMRGARVVIANDTGPMHLAVACGAPTLALFRAADPTRWGHARLGHVVIPVDEGDPAAVEARAGAALDRLLSVGSVADVAP